MTNIFHIKNPNHLGLVGESLVPFPNQKELRVARGSGPVIDMCYTLFERNRDIPGDEAQSYPTIDDHDGWNIIGEGVFKGWEKQSEEEGFEQEIWHPIIHRKDGDGNRVLNSVEQRDLIKFKRVERRGRMTNKIKSRLYWRRCKWYTHKATMESGKAKLKVLSRNHIGDLGELDFGMPENIMSYLTTTRGGKRRALIGKTHRKKRRKKSKRRKSKRNKRRKSKRKKSKTRKSKGNPKDIH